MKSTAILGNVARAEVRAEGSAAVNARDHADPDSLGLRPREISCVPSSNYRHASPTRLARSSTYGRHRFCLGVRFCLVDARRGRAQHGSAIVSEAGHFTAGDGMIKSEQRCEGCGAAFWFARDRIPDRGE